MKVKPALSKGELTRAAVLDAAYELINKQGYAATSMRQIADKAGLSLGSIYNHFDSKDAVFKAIVEDRHPFLQMLPVLNSVPGNSIEEYVHNAAHALIQEMRKHPEFLNLMLTEIVEFRGGHVPALFKKIFPVILPVAERMQSLEGELRPIPSVVLARAFLGMFISYYVTEILIAKALPPELREINTMDHLVDIFLHGILAEEKA